MYLFGHPGLLLDIFLLNGNQRPEASLHLKHKRVKLVIEKAADTLYKIRVLLYWDYFIILMFFFPNTLCTYVTWQHMSRACSVSKARDSWRKKL